MTTDAKYVFAAYSVVFAVILVYLVGSWHGLVRLAGVDSVADPRSIGLLMALAAIAGLVSGPLGNALSRRIEARADAHALALTDDPVTFEAMEGRLAAVNLADPDPPRLEHVIFATHPTTVERMAAARAYARTRHAATSGAPPWLVLRSGLPASAAAIQSGSGTGGMSCTMR